MSDIANTNTNAMAWPAKPLGEVFWINGDQVAPMASRKAEFVHYSIPAWDATGGPAIELGSQIESNKTAVSNPAVLVSKLNPRKPRVVAITTPSERTCCSTEFICYQPKQSNEDLGFWAAYFASTDFCSRLTRVAVGSTNSHTRASPKETLKWLVPEVPSIEQHKIAQVLVTLDTAIHETEAIIAKLKAVKQGLLHDLLTRGIDANGELRPPQAEAPQLYKESALGWIPKEWDVSGLANIALKDRSVIRTGPFGSSLKGEHWRESGRPVVTIGSLGETAFVTSELLYIEEATAARLAEFELIPGDIVFSRVADVGRSVVVSESERGWIMSSNFMRISCDSAKARPQFLQMLLSSSVLVRKQLRTTVNSAGRDVANSAVLMGLSFPWPSPLEQDDMLRRMRTLSQRLAQEQAELKKLLDCKAGLMDDLLTGRVRVTPLLEGDSTSQTGQQLAGQMPG